MRYKSDASVHSSDGTKIGRVRGVVMTPGSDAITGIIVEKGLLFTEDRMIPVDWIAQTLENGDIRLSEEHQTFDNLERFDEDAYMRGEISSAAETGVPPTYYYGAPGYIPNAANLGPALATDHSMQDRAEMGIEEDDIVLHVGIEVFSSDDHKVGKVDEVIASPPDNRLSQFVISQGTLFGTRKIIRMQWIAELQSEQVKLAVNRDFIDRLPDFDARQENTQGDEYANDHSADNMSTDRDSGVRDGDDDAPGG